MSDSFADRLYNLWPNPTRVSPSFDTLVRQFYSSVTYCPSPSTVEDPSSSSSPAAPVIVLPALRLFSDGVRWTTAGRANLLESGYAAAPVSGPASLAVFRQSLDQQRNADDDGNEDDVEPVLVCALPEWIEQALHTTDTFKVRFSLSFKKIL